MVGGASKGLGFAVARALAFEGAQVSIASRSREAIFAAAERIKQETGAAVHALEGDFTGVFGRIVPLGIGVAVGAQAGASLARWVGGVWIIRALVVALAFVGVRLVILAWHG